MSDYLLEMKGIVKEFGGVRALNGIDIQVKAGECIGLCGENGAGKSTLMKVLSGVYPHGTWDGEILWRGQPLKAQSVRDTEAAGIIIIHQELMLVPELSVAENIFMGHELTLPGGRMNYAAMYRRADELLRELKIPEMNVALPVLNYGGGHQQLVEIAKALNKNAKLLILDEPSSSLTTSEIQVLLDIIRGLKKQGVTCIYISHKLDEVAAICDTIVVIRDGQHIATTPMDKMNVESIIAQMVGREMTQLYPKEKHPIGEIVFEARNVTCLDVDNPLRKRVDNVSFQLRKGEILGIAGIVGAGRTELVRAIAGADRITAGQILIDGAPVRLRDPQDAIRAGVSLVPEDRKLQGVVLGHSIENNLTYGNFEQLGSNGWVRPSGVRAFADKLIGQLGIKGRAAQPASDLSGGNQQKIVIAKCIARAPKVIILDEPTRGIDVGARAAIYEVMADLARSGMAVIVVSSDLDEVLGLSHRVLVISRGEARGILPRDQANSVAVMELATL